jgi:hypothetical protein
VGSATQTTVNDSWVCPAQVHGQTLRCALNRKQSKFECNRLLTTTEPEHNRAEPLTANLPQAGARNHEHLRNNPAVARTAYPTTAAASGDC